jgi:hypothetical protein
MSQEERKWHPILEPDNDARAERFTTTDWFLKLKETEKYLDRTTVQFLNAQRQIQEMNDVMGWLLKISEKVYQKKYRTARKWLDKALIRYPWLFMYFNESRIDTANLIPEHESEESVSDEVPEN